MLLSDLPRNATATVVAVSDVLPDDPIAARLRDLGFVPGESVRITAKGPLGGDPLLIQIGYTRFALRHAEAARVQIRSDGVKG